MGNMHSTIENLKQAITANLPYRNELSLLQFFLQTIFMIFITITFWSPYTTEDK